MKQRRFGKLRFWDWVKKNKKTQERDKCEEIAFELRKREFLSNAAGIITYLERIQQKGGRKHLLLCVTSKNWTLAELKGVIYLAQKSFADVSVYIENNIADINALSAYFFEEYGLRLLVVNTFDVLTQGKYDTLLALVTFLDEGLRSITCQNAYAVCESETTFNRIRKKIHVDSKGEVMRICKEEHSDWYSGFVYAANGKQISYKDALMLLYNEESMQMHESNTVEKAISIVAIYGIE